MSDYTYGELMKMQNDAIKRVEDMQRRARQSAGLEAEKTEQNREAEVSVQEPRRVPMPNDYLEKLKSFAANSSYGEDMASTEKEEPKKGSSIKKELAEKNNGSFGDFNLDSDTALLLSLVLLLSEEKADEILIMALLYMLT